MESRILNLLRENADRAYQPKEISLLIGHPEPRAKLVNPTLYKLWKKGLIIKMTNSKGSRPHWRIA